MRMSERDVVSGCARYGVVAFVAVTFHVERGPGVDSVFPPDALRCSLAARRAPSAAGDASARCATPRSAQEAADVSFCAFNDAGTSVNATAGCAPWAASPDVLALMQRTLRDSVLDAVYAIRVPRRGAPCHLPMCADVAGAPPQRLSVPRRALPKHAGGTAPVFLSGYVYSREHRDGALPRGCERRAVAVLATRPLACFLSPLVLAVGQQFFSDGPAALVHAAAAVAALPPPAPRALLSLAVGEASVSARLPPLESLAGQAPVFADAALAAPQTSELHATDRLHTWLLADALNATSAASAMAPLAAEPTPGPLAAASSLTQLACFAEVDVYRPLRGVLLHAWTLWELLVTGAPLLVFAPTPSDASATVTALVALAPQLADARDWRPYFTVHDSSFAVRCVRGSSLMSRCCLLKPFAFLPLCVASAQALSSGQDAPAPADGHRFATLPTVLGVTNRMFLRTLQHWPHVLTVGCQTPEDCTSGRTPATANGDATSGRQSAHEDSAVLAPGALRRTASSPAPARPQGPQARTAAAVDAVSTPLRPALSPDTALLNRLDALESATRGAAREPGCGACSGSLTHLQADAVANACAARLRAAFAELTADLLAPFAPFVTSVHPGAGAALYRGGGTAGGPLLPAFDAENFLASLDLPGAVPPPGRALMRRVASPTALRALYARVLAGGPFQSWYAAARANAERMQAAAWAAARADADVPSFARELSEVELVDAFGAVEAALDAALDAAHVASALSAAAAAISAGAPGAKLSFGAGGGDARGASAPPAETATTAKLRRNLRALFDALPEDTRALMAAHPHRAALLQLPVTKLVS